MGELAQLGERLLCTQGGQRFDPAILHHIYYKNKIRYKLLYIEFISGFNQKRYLEITLVILSNMIFKNIMLKSLKFFS